MLVAFSDNLVVSRLGEKELAAAAVTNGIASIPLVFGIGFCIPITSLVAQAMGERNEDKVSEVFWHGLVQCMLLGALLAIGGQFLYPILAMTGQDPEVLALIPNYMSWVVWSLWPLMLYQCFKQFVEGQGDTQAAMYMGLATVGVNTLLNFWFVFGWGPIEAMGIVGAGVATFWSRVFLALALMVYVLAQRRYRRVIGHQREVRWLRSAFGRLLALGMPISMQMLFEVSVFGIAALIVGQHGAVHLAAHQTVLTVAGFTFMAVSGLATATTIRVGFYYGAKQPFALHTAAMVGFWSAVVFMGTMSLLLLATHQVLPYMYLSEPETVALAAQIFLLAALFQVADGTQVVLLGALRGMNDVKLPTLITFGAYWVLAMPLGYVLCITYGWGAVGMWIGLTSGLFFAAVMLYLRLKWRMEKFKTDPGLDKSVHVIHASH